MINPNAIDGRKGLILGNRMTLRMAKGAVLKALPSSSEGYALLEVASVSDVNIIGGTLLGERDTHRGTRGEWGMGLDINHATNVVVQDVTARDCWGDGFYIGLASRNITFCGVIADRNRRQGLSITGADGVIISRCTFKNSAGTPMEMGLDIEPNRGETVCNVLITGSTFAHNAGEGLASGVPGAHSGRAFVYKITIEGNTILENGSGSGSHSIHNGIEISNSSGTKILNNVLRGNHGRGILLRFNADNSYCKGNKIFGTTGPPGDAIAEDSCMGNTIVDNQFSGNAGRNVYSAGCRQSTIRDNLNVKN